MTQEQADALTALHDRLYATSEGVWKDIVPLVAAVNSDTALAIGQALGALDKAVALLSRDINSLAARQ